MVEATSHKFRKDVLEPGKDAILDGLGLCHPMSSLKTRTAKASESIVALGFPSKMSAEIPPECQLLQNNPAAFGFGEFK